MKIRHFHKSEAKITVESLDDLWYLSAIIESGDTVSGKTLRKIKIGESSDRSQKIVRKPVFLKLKVEKIEFHKYSDNLRISGTIIEGPEDIPRGSYHTFNVEEGTELTILKTEWLKFQKQKLDESAKAKTPDILIVVHDREEAFFALLKRSGLQHLTELKGSVAKKAETQQVVKDFYSEVLSVMEDYAKRHKVNHIIVASPAFWKEELMKKVKDADLKKKIVLATSSSADKNAINEVVKRPETQNVLKQERSAKEMKLVDELLKEISKNGASAYGVEETKGAIDAGAVKSLLLTDGFIQKRRQEESFDEIEKMMKTADRSDAEISIISSDHEGGKKLDGLGGIAALLRYKMNY